MLESIKSRFAVYTLHKSILNLKMHIDDLIKTDSELLCWSDNQFCYLWVNSIEELITV